MLFWPAIVLDALGIVASAAALLVHAVMWHYVSTTIKTNKDAEFTIPASKLKRWVRMNVVMTLILTLNMTRWFILNDIPKITGNPTRANGAFDDFTWAICDILLIALPIILIGNMRAAVRGKDDPRG